MSVRIRTLLFAAIMIVAGCASATDADGAVSSSAAPLVPQPVSATTVPVKEPVADVSPGGAAEEASARALAPAPTPTPASTDTVAGVGSISVATGVVVEVDGDLSSIREFAIRLKDGATLELIPEPGLLFAGGPLSHVRDHLVSGAPVRVEYRQAEGSAIVTAIGDAG